MFKSWFGSDKIEVPDLEEIKIIPEIVIPEKTRRELYDLAVAEVQHKRVVKLVEKGFKDFCIDDEETLQTKDAISEYNTDYLSYDKVIEIKKKYPLACFSYPSGYNSRIYLQVPEVSLHRIYNQIATMYLSE